MPDFNSINELNITEEDKVAMAEAYRVFELLDDEEKEKIPAHFIETLLYFGDFKSVSPFSDIKELKRYSLSKKAKYLVMYMCTFENA